MKDHPILFSAPMVRAILSGQKTQTRRVVKPRKDKGIGCILAPCELAGEVNSGDFLNSAYEPGERLWVRETWAKNEGISGGFCYRADHGGACAYEAHDLAKGLVTHKVSKWKPSIHMPRAASRITLEITGVRVERLKDISEQDARAEGAPGYEEGIDAPPPDSSHEWSYRASFQRLWESINGAGSWEVNPWVWVVEFKRI